MTVKGREDTRVFPADTFSEEIIMSWTTFPICLGFALLLAATPASAADKSITPDGKPAPSQPAAKPGSKAAMEAESTAKPPYSKVDEVFSGDETVAGEKVVFPQDNPSIKALVVTMAPGEQTDWHQHHAPLFAYILEGEITVTYEELGKKVYRQGEGLLEAMDLTHRGENTGTGPARILAVFLLGDGGKPTVIEAAPGDDKARVE
ncbi:cupin domain-containing protein [Labrenzia sp. OB1]|uniref:cupin domain-containing protein n=1 Tax=Labrenzia sp. OB1 TaxID=1561204 RepID=UPI000ABF1C4C|nr:cupin domain-containing protein [Labrenzia sp. OB1]